MIGSIDAPGSLLAELDRDKLGLIGEGMRADGQPTHFVFDKQRSRHTTWATIWLMGNSLIVRELEFESGREREEWHMSFIDVDLITGDVYSHDESHLGVGFSARNIFEADYYPGTDGVRLKLLHNLLFDLAFKYITDPSVIHAEPPVNQ